MNNINFNQPNFDAIKGQAIKKLKPVRVVDIILDDSHPDYELFGKEASIGAIRYIPIDSAVSSNEKEYHPIAYPLTHTLRQFPLINEVVLLHEGPGALGAAALNSKTNTVLYYTDIVSIWNTTNYNGIPYQLDVEAEPGYDFVENDKVLPLQPFYGDTVFQGRQGQSIRFTGTKHPKNKLTDTSNENSPLSIFTLGEKSKNEKGFRVEDINKDYASIYLTSNHQIPLEQSRDKYEGRETKPIQASDYKGKQILLSSGRLVFNTSEEDILFSSEKYVTITSEATSIDGKKYIGLDANKIYLGKSALKFELEPVIKGDQLETLLDTLITTVERIGNAMKKAKTVDQKIIPVLNLEGPVAVMNAKSLKTMINPGGASQIKSKKVFTE